MTTLRSAALALCTVLVAATVGGGAAGATAAGAPANCTLATAPPPPLRPTTVRTLEQAYECVFAHYYDGAALDDRTLLNGAFAGLTGELVRLGLDQRDATAPALTGDRRRDWAAFRAVYQRVTGHLPADPDTRQAVAAATMNGMLNGLHDNHAGWSHGGGFAGGPGAGTAYGLGFTTFPALPVFVGSQTKRCRRCSSPPCRAGRRPSTA
jgi:carboxyl-terminal processing protease